MQAVSQEERMRRVILASGVVSLRLPWTLPRRQKMIVSCPANHDGCRTAVRIRLLPLVSLFSSFNCSRSSKKSHHIHFHHDHGMMLLSIDFGFLYH